MLMDWWDEVLFELWTLQCEKINRRWIVSLFLQEQWFTTIKKTINRKIKERLFTTVKKIINRKIIERLFISLFNRVCNYSIYFISFYLMK